MIRTQIYLTESERAALGVLAATTGKAQSELIRKAVDNLIEQSSEARREAVFNKAAGLWEDRNDLPDFKDLRRQWDREDRT